MSFFNFFRKKNRPRAYFRWKEQLIFEDAGLFLVFEAPMGVSPCDVYVPPEKLWREKLPAWAHDRREEILLVIRNTSGVKSIIEDETAWVGTVPEG